MPNIEFRPYERPSMWRRMSLANWSQPRDPQVYGRMEVDMTRAIAWLESRSAMVPDIKLTQTHLVARAVALGLANVPEANAMVRGGRLCQRRDVDVFLQVAIPGKKADLSGVVIRNMDTKPIEKIAEELSTRASKVRAGTDKETAAARSSLDRLPQFLYRPLLWLLSFLQYTLNLNPKLLGLPRDPFGSAMVTSIGSLGIDEGYAPLVPMSRCPLVVAVGRTRERVVAVDGKAEIHPVCVLTATFDHRLMDGLIAGRLARYISDYLANPEPFEAELEKD